eukprot:CAMPEP_0117421908 /NCGR_PEP_ID=MMETSP0758-20121206/2859_1 /TAXON_ID=63605 /ORGANISM="Percolomonas cosmopolitus, Strain AE-1 (ATCC 50343)" /LENGTH=254 /DNA_ID=CAMNT_0005204221 /DNA_START=834 /DNA_END=1599 /DNA_ORIENTATION=+
MNYIKESFLDMVNSYVDNFGHRANHLPTSRRMDNWGYFRKVWVEEFFKSYYETIMNLLKKEYKASTEELQIYVTKPDSDDIRHELTINDAFEWVYNSTKQVPLSEIHFISRTIDLKLKEGDNEVSVYQLAKGLNTKVIRMDQLAMRVILKNDKFIALDQQLLYAAKYGIVDHTKPIKVLLLEMNGDIKKEYSTLKDITATTSHDEIIVDDGHPLLHQRINENGYFTYAEDGTKNYLRKKERNALNSVRIIDMNI